MPMISCVDGTRHFEAVITEATARCRKDVFDTIAPGDIPSPLQRLTHADSTCLQATSQKWHVPERPMVTRSVMTMAIV
jgi:hypothetical protein